jgi:hypothetical protein
MAGGKGFLRLGAGVLAVGLAGVWYFTNPEPDAFARIREFSDKLRTRALEAAAQSLAEDQAAALLAEHALRPDLLLAYGSWNGEQSVPHVFGLPDVAPETLSHDLSSSVDGPVATLMGDGLDEPEETETAPTQARSDLPAPASHQVTLVILGSDVARAVVDAAVVSLGDNLAEGRIVQIHSHGLVVRGEHGLVAYDVGAREGRRLGSDELDGDSGGGR